MNRSEYIAALTGALRGKLAAGEIEDIVRDYNEFFEDGVMQGKTEEQVVVELGDPLEVAQQILSEEKFEPGREKAPEGESSFKQRFTQGAEKVADGAEDFAKKANSFTRRKLEEYEERRSRRAEEKAARRSSGPRPRSAAVHRERNGGCMLFLLKALFLIIVAPVAVLFLAACLTAFCIGGAGIVAAVCGFVALAILLPAVPFIAVLCAIFGLLFVIFFCVTAMMAVVWLAKAGAVFVRDLLFGRRIDDDYFDRAFRVSESAPSPNAGWHYGPAGESAGYAAYGPEPGEDADSADGDGSDTDTGSRDEQDGGEQNV